MPPKSRWNKKLSFFKLKFCVWDRKDKKGIFGTTKHPQTVCGWSSTPRPKIWLFVVLIKQLGINTSNYLSKGWKWWKRHERKKSTSITSTSTSFVSEKVLPLGHYFNLLSPQIIYDCVSVCQERPASWESEKISPGSSIPKVVSDNNKSYWAK